jgi:hypothetical protein
MDAGEEAEVLQSAAQRLLSGEYPESIARDLSQHTHLVPLLRAAFQEASVEQRKRGKRHVVVGAVVSVFMVILVLSFLGAGICVTGPGLLIGLYALASGVSKIRNARDIAAAASLLGTSTQQANS